METGNWMSLVDFLSHWLNSKVNVLFITQKQRTFIERFIILMGTSKNPSLPSITGQSPAGEFKMPKNCPLDFTVVTEMLLLRA